MSGVANCYNRVVSPDDDYVVAETYISHDALVMHAAFPWPSNFGQILADIHGIRTKIVFGKTYQTQTRILVNKNILFQVLKFILPSVCGNLYVVIQSTTCDEHLGSSRKIIQQQLKDCEALDDKVSRMQHFIKDPTSLPDPAPKSSAVRTWCGYRQHNMPQMSANLIKYEWICENNFSISN